MLNIPYGNTYIEYDEGNASVLTSGIDSLRSSGSGSDIVRRAMLRPIDSPRLCELARGKRNCVIIISDHTRPVPSRDIIPNMLQNGEKMAAYRFSGYWKDVGTLDSLWDANMDMLATGSGLDLLEKDWPIYGRPSSAPPAYLGKNAHVEHSVVARGCTVEGEAENSVLSERCTVEEGASVQYSLLMPGAVIRRGAQVSYAIIGENAVVEANARVGQPP